MTDHDLTGAEMSDALLKQFEWDGIIMLLEQFLMATCILLALSGFCGLGVVIGALPATSAGMFFVGAIGCLLSGLLVTTVKWCFWRRRWAGDGQ